MTLTPTSTKIDELVKGTVGILSKERRWVCHAERNTQHLKRCLASIVDRVVMERYNDGYIRPAVSITTLKSIKSMAQTADRTGRCDKLADRLATYHKEDHDLIHLLLWQVAQQRDPDNPSKAVLDLDPEIELERLSRKAPLELAILSATIIDQLEPQKQVGKGGNRSRPGHEKRFVIEELGLHFDITTGEVPGTSFHPTLPAQDQHGGPFLELCSYVLEALGMPTTTSQAYELLRSIDNQYWVKMRAQRGFGRKGD